MSFFAELKRRNVYRVAVMYVIDVTQTSHAIRRNFPVIGRFRYLFEHLGEFFRQYFFAMDREEMPFNRAERTYVYRAAKGVDTTIAFGSSRDPSRKSKRSSRFDSILGTTRDPGRPVFARPPVLR